MLIKRAVDFAKAKHATQKRKYTNDPYVTHVCIVADMVRMVGARDAVVAAAVLHDVLEDTNTTELELRREFGDEITNLVVELTDVFTDPVKHGNRKERKAKEKNRLASVSADAQTIKVADLIDNTISIVARDPGFAKVYVPEKVALLKVLTKAHPVLLARAYESVKSHAA